tara:strand:+ start:869 stop:2116 length:1248 start_codon:yes stop_codon:yes gene_type:complete
MADLFQIGYGGGPPKAIDYSKALDPLVNKIGARLKESKAKTDALMMNMPQGVPIDKVPEQLRGQVTDFLTQNKQAYVDASKVIASGIPSTDQRYIDAVSTINQVDAKFKNLSNTLEDIALKRQAALDGREHGKGSLSWQISDHEDLANGTMYDNMIIQDDGGFNYRSNDNVEKSWTDYSNTFQTSSIGTDAFYALDDIYKNAGRKGDKIDETRAREQFTNTILRKLKTDGARDFMFSDREFLATKIKAEFGTNEYNNELDKLVNGGNTKVLLKEFEDFKVKQLMTSNTNTLNQYNTLMDQKSNALKTRSQVTQKEFFTKVPDELKGEYDKNEVAIGINEIKTRKKKFDKQEPFQGQFYFYAYDPVMKKYLQFKNIEDYQENIKDGVIKGGKPVSNRLLTEQERLDETGITTLNFG